MRRVAYTFTKSVTLKTQKNIWNIDITHFTMKKALTNQILFFGLLAIILAMLHRSNARITISNEGSLRERK